MLDRKRYLRSILKTSEIKLEDQTTIIEKQMRRHFAEHAPEKLELLDAMLADNGKTH